MPVSFVKTKNKKKKKKKIEGKIASVEIKTNDAFIDVQLKRLAVTEVGCTESLDACSETQATSANGGGWRNLQKCSRQILAVDPKFLRAEDELRRIFGSKVINACENSNNSGNSWRKQGPRRGARIYQVRKTNLVVPSDHWPRWDGGMSMEHIETKEGMHFFRYARSSSYLAAQKKFEVANDMHDLNGIALNLVQHPYHVESLLALAEAFKFAGDYQRSAEAIEKCLYALECAWHPLFNPMRGDCRLKYSCDANRPLFLTLLCHMQNLDRRGCHRAALEVCKMLLSLDSDDPVGALFCIDYFSLRSKQYEWLELFADQYVSDNSLWLLPNFSFSLAVARFYLECDTLREQSPVQTDTVPSIDVLKQALMLHPLVLRKIVDKAPLKDVAWTQILNHPHFAYAEAGSPSLEHLIQIYMEKNYIIWRLPELQKWLKDAALQVIQTVNEDKGESKNWACVRKEAFPSDKNEYSHLHIVNFADSVPPPEDM
uniref:Transcription factor 25 n=1 Tax=Araucaria cunninghamii TaxID=56994 RepID=A0A0D6R3M4_ARACU